MPSLSPKRLFIIDGVGALVSSFLLGIALVRFQSVVGIPSETLYLLASFPIGFAIYDFIAFRVPSKAGTLLMGIAIMNILYCLLSLSLAFYHMESLTLWGWAYILGEIAVIVVLAMLEIRTGKASTK